MTGVNGKTPTVEELTPIDLIAAAAGVDKATALRVIEAQGEVPGVRVRLPQDEFETSVENRIQRLKVEDEARRRLRAAEADALTLPPHGLTLATLLDEEPEPTRFIVDRLLPEDGNALLVGGFKVGKTTALGNLVASLADGTPYLGVFQASLPQGRVAYLNYEVSPNQFHNWLRDLDLAHPERVIPVDLRGQRLPFWVPEVRRRFADWCLSNEVAVLVLDPVGRAWRGLVENENDNSNVRQFTDAVDELKAEAGLSAVVLAHHTGRKEHEQDSEHGRGATTLEDWMDAGWYLTKDRDGTRMLRAIGRDVDVAPTALSYDGDRRQLQWTGQNRAERRRAQDVVRALDALVEIRRRGDRYPTPSGEWRTAIVGTAKEARSAAMDEAVRRKFVKVSAGPKNAKLHGLTKRGRKYLDEHKGAQS